MPSRLTHIAQGGQVASVQYDAAGRRSRLTLPNQVSTEYQYDAGSRLAALIYRNATGQLGDLRYQYDPAGNRTGIGGSFARTGFPNPVASASYNGANRQVSFGSQMLTYDPNGNLTSDGVNLYTWNARNQLLAITGTSMTATFSYDALGRRQSRSVNGASTQFLYDGLTPIQEAGSTGIATLLTGLGIDEYLTRTDAAGARALVTDALGSTVALTDAAGVVQTQYTYEPFGATAPTGSANANAFQYTGRENDGTGLYYYRARYYHPTFQRFLSEDPIGAPGSGINLYRYVSNNPLMWIDPFGLVNAISGGVVTFDFWENPKNFKAGMGWYVTITNANGYRWQYGHMDPSTTPPVGTVIQPGQYIGDYADPTNGYSTAPHVHLQLKDPTGQLIDPGPWSPIPGGCISGPWGEKRSRGSHQGVDYRNPGECRRPGPPAVGGDDLGDPTDLSGRK